jgi:hypothetical protein
VFLSIDKKNQFLTRFGYYADQAYLKFSLSISWRKSTDALVKPFSIVLSKTLADKLFPYGKALGNQVYGKIKLC